MRILNISMNATFTEGYSYQDNLLSEYQHKLGHEVTILTGLFSRDKTGNKILTSPCEKFMENGVKLIRIKPDNKLAQFIGCNSKIKQIIWDINPDLIFIHGLCSLIPKVAVNYKKNNPKTILVADNHQDEFNYNYNKLPFSILHFIWKSGWKKWNKYFNYIYGTTGWRKEFAIDHFGIPSNKTDLLPLGVDTDNISRDSLSIRQSIRQLLLIPEDSFVFIHGGKMNKDKRTIDIINSFSKLNGKDYRLLLFGSIDKGIENSFKALIEKDERIIYVGYLPSKEIHKYFFASDFAVFPGLHSVLWEEAIGCGLPGIFQSFGVSNHTNLHGNSILIKASSDADEIHNIMKRICSNYCYYSVLKQNAEIASKDFCYYDIALKSIRN